MPLLGSRTARRAAALLVLPAVALGAATAVAGSAPRGTATVLRHTDATGDVTASSSRATEGGRAAAPAGPGSAAAADGNDADILRTVSTWPGEAITTKVDVAAVPTEGLYAYVDVLVPDGTRYYAASYTSRTSPSVGLYDYETGQQLDCPALRSTVNRRSDRVTVDLPPSCVGDPDSVRVGVATFLSVGGVGYADDARSSGPYNVLDFSTLSKKSLVPST